MKIKMIMQFNNNLFFLNLIIVIIIIAIFINNNVFFIFGVAKNPKKKVEYIKAYTS
jgi:hypothetical protein